MIALVTDSNSQVPASLVARFGITVVPLPVTVDGVEYLEGVDLDVEDFYARFRSATPVVATAQPSPGRFAATYGALVAGGATEILSIHIGSAVSGTINAARLGAAGTTVPIRIVDSGTASFGITLCAWAAAEALAAGVSVEEAAMVAERTASGAGNVFVVRALDLARAGGRLAPAEAGAGGVREGGGVPILSMTGGTMQVLGRATDLDEAAEAMAGYVTGAGGHDLRVGVGHGDAGMAALADRLEARLAGVPQVREVVRYRVGPSVGAHTGPGTVGVMFAPAS